ncbi:hypothetical protein ECO2947_15485 [Escherichia coli]|nr:hypothetical protein ECO2947_15485 [Escherichia coli]
MGQHGKSLPSFDAPETLKGRKIEWEYENLTHGNKAYNGYVTVPFLTEMKIAIIRMAKIKNAGIKIIPMTHAPVK